MRAINEYGFIESPYKKSSRRPRARSYRVVKVGDTSFTLGQIVEKKELQKENNRIAKETHPLRKKKGQLQLAEAEPYAFYLSAWDEERYTIAQANVVMDRRGQPRARPRHRAADRRVRHHREGGEVDFIDVSPKAARLRRRLARSVPRERTTRTAR